MSRCPSGKRSYATYAAAIAALVEATTDPSRAEQAYETQTYICPRCGRWHLSKKATVVRRRRRVA